MSEEQKHEIQQGIQQLESLQEGELDLETISEEVGLEGLNNGQGLAETGASIGAVGCCSLCMSKS